MQWAAARGEKFDHCVLGEPSNVETLGDCIKIGRRGSQSGTLYVEGIQGHVAYPHRAVKSGAGYFAPDRGAERRAARSRQRAVPGLESRIHLRRCRQRRHQRDSRTGAGKFNIRYNDLHTQASLRELVEARLAKAAGNRIKAHIVWEPSNSNVFVTKPGAFTDLAVAAIEEVTGRKPELSTSGGTSDARFISHYCPVIEFGLVGQTMHQIDERTPVADLEKLTEIYRGILDRYFG